MKVKNITEKELNYVKKLTGDESMTKNRLQSGKWFLPDELAIDTYKYLKRKGKMK